MTDTPAVPKPSVDAQGREVFTVHPQILGGGAPYRKVVPAGAPAEAVDSSAAARAARPRSNRDAGQ